MKEKTNPGKDTQRVLVIKLSALGDFVLSFGAMKVIREHHPSAEITLLTTPPYEELAKNSPYADVVETDGRPPKLTGTYSLLKRIHRSNYDVVYDLMGNKRTCSYFHALKWFFFGRTPLWNGTAKGCDFYYPNELRVKTHTIERLSAQLECAKISLTDNKSGTRIAFPDLSWVHHKFGKRPEHQPSFFGLSSPYVLIIPGASGRQKCWSPENYAEIARRITDAGMQPALIGSHLEIDLGDQITEYEPRVKSLIAKTDLFQLVSLAARANFVIGNDTGPMHLATLSGASGVVLFSTSNSTPEIHAPRGREAKNVIIVEANTFEKLGVEEVWEAILELEAL